MSSAQVKTIMRSKVPTLHPDDPLTKAFQAMVRSGGRHLPVLVDGVVVGIVSEGDLVRGAVRRSVHDLLVRHVMTGNVHTVPPTENVDVVAARFIDEHIACMPVVDKGRLVGIVTLTDVVATFERDLAGPPAAKRAAPRAKRSAGRHA